MVGWYRTIAGKGKLLEDLSSRRSEAALVTVGKTLEESFDRCICEVETSGGLAIFMR
jgi:hypothetical protein